MVMKNLILISTLLVVAVSSILLAFGSVYGGFGICIGLVSSIYNKYI